MESEMGQENGGGGNLLRYFMGYPDVIDIDGLVRYITQFLKAYFNCLHLFSE